ncbi:MAG: 3-phosphoshikimate 1-carboxyvinyltransferase [Vampirovibrionia bacterium]
MTIDTLDIIPATSPLTGTIEIPSDKSLSHRSVILGSICNGKLHVKNFSLGADCKSTVGILKNLGIEIEYLTDSTLLVHGRGLKGFKEPKDILDAGNSGTTIRIMLGILSGQSFYSVLTGDDCLKKRPMGRVIKPLSSMGSQILARENNTVAPITICGGNLNSIEYKMPIASAQVKSSILLAGLYANGTTIVTEPAKSRDHTERLLKYLGADITVDGLSVSVTGQKELEPKEIKIPGDISSASFFIVAATIVEGSSLTLTNVGINPTRTGLLSVLQNMGADITIENEREVCGEPVGDIVVNYSNLKAIEISGEIIPTLIDEVPIIAVAASVAEGTTIIKDAQDLRNKESDRLKAITSELKKMGVDIEETPDGLIINGSKKIEGGCTCESHFDHRIAMAITIASLAAKNPVTINNADWIKISFPEFSTILNKLREKDYGKQIF